MKRLSIIVLFFCASAHTWAQEAAGLIYTEAVANSQVSGPSPYFSIVHSIGLDFLTGAPDEMKLRHWGSRISKEQLYYNIPTKIPYLTVSAGLGLSQESYVFRHPYVLRRNPNDGKCILAPLDCKLGMSLNERNEYEVHIKFKQENPTTSLSVSYIELFFPELRLGAKHQAPASGFFLTLGPALGIRWDQATQHIKYQEDNEQKQETLSESFRLSDFRCGFIVRLEWEHFSIFYTQTLTGLFHENMGPSGDKITHWSAGLSISLI